MNNLLEAGSLMLKQGLSVLPTGLDKKSTITWKPLQSKALTTEELETALANPSAEAIGIVTGSVSGNLEVIDIDSKYDITGQLENDLLACIDPELLEKIVIARTKGNGLHLYYRAPVVSGNEKLARRYTTDQERATNPNEKIKVLVETRGEGGYVIAPPSYGYTYLQGDYSTIPTISDQERSYLLSIARSFNEVEDTPTTQEITTSRGEDLTPWKEFNLTGSSDVIALLQARGWSIVGETGERIYLKRAGESSSRYSGNYHKGLNKLYVFSTSTELQDGKALSNTDVLLQLECNGDTKELNKKLREMGYGKPYSSSSPDRVDVIEAPTNTGEFTEKELEEFKELLQPLTRDKIREDLKKEKANLPTGFFLKDGDREIELKIPSGQLTIVAGRTSHRKTGTMLNLCKEISDRIKDQEGKLLFLSYEESSTNIQLKLFNVIANMGYLDPKGDLSNTEYMKAYYKGEIEASKEFIEAENKFYQEYIDSGRIVVKYCNYMDKKLARAVTYLANQNSYSAIFIDYLQLVRSEDIKGKSRQEQLYNICEELRNVSIETRIPLIFGAQFNREVQARTDIDSNKLREAGDIEQTANLVLGLWDNNFNPDGEKVKYKEGKPTTPDRENSLYIEVLKGRDIGIGWKESFEYNPPTGALAIKQPNKKPSNIKKNKWAK
jgi:hypothetical protein